MDFTLTEDQAQLERSIGQVMARPIADDAAWDGFARLGWLAIGLPEAAGGIGGAVEAMLVMQGFGAAGLAAPFVPTVVLGAGLVARLGTAAQLALLPRVAAGELRLAVAVSEPPEGFSPVRCATVAEAVADGHVLTGRKTMVLGAAGADLLLVPAVLPGGGVGVFLVPPSRAGLLLMPGRLLDGRGVADLSLDRVAVAPGDLLGGGAAEPGVLEAVCDRAIAAICADAVGAMRRAIGLTIEHLKTRRQFGRPLATFQVLQHRVVDMHMEAEHALSMAQVAAMACEADDPVRRARLVAAAKARVGRAARFVGEQAVQLHGGIGMTAEHAIGRLTKRLLADDLLFGDRAYHLDRLAGMPP